MLADCITGTLIIVKGRQEARTQNATAAGFKRRKSKMKSKCCMQIGHAVLLAAHGMQVAPMSAYFQPGGGGSRFSRTASGGDDTIDAPEYFPTGARVPARRRKKNYFVLGAAAVSG